MTTNEEKIAMLDDAFPPDVAEMIKRQFDDASKEAGKRGLVAKEKKPKMSKFARKAFEKYETEISLRNMVRLMGDVVAGQKLYNAIRAQEAEQRRLDEKYKRVKLKQDSEISAKIQDLIAEIKSIPRGDVDLGWNGPEQGTLDLPYFLAALPPGARVEFENFIAKQGLATGDGVMYKDARSDIGRGWPGELPARGAANPYEVNPTGPDETGEDAIKALMDHIRRSDPKLYKDIVESIAKFGLDREHHTVVSDADLVANGQKGPSVPRRESVQKELRVVDPIDAFTAALAPGAQNTKLSKKERKAAQNPLGVMLTGTKFKGTKR